MNTILKKRIEEAARLYADKAVHYIDDSEEDMIKVMVDFTEQMLSHQWISVEEALPPIREKDIENRSWSDWVLIMTHEGGAFTDCYAFHRKEWINNGNDVTHWMEIPTLPPSK